MISYNEFKKSGKATAYYVGGYKVYDTKFDHCEKYSIIHIAGIGVHHIYCESDFNSFANSLFFDKAEAIRSCLKKIHDELVVPLENMLKEVS